jgi:chitinase
LGFALDAASGALFQSQPSRGWSMVCRSLQFTRLMFSVLVVLVVLAFLPTASAQKTLANGLTKRVVGDYGYWSKYQTPPYGAAQIPYNELTHINHAGVGFDSTGTLQVPDGFLEPELNNMAHANGVKVLLLLGGDFVGLESSGQVQTLVDNIAAFEQQYAYDGLDIDWEYPEGQDQRRFMVELMAKFRASNSNYVLSIDAAPWGGPGYALKNLAKSLDYVNIMMYDCAGPWTADGQLNSPIFWNYHDPNPWECEPGGSVEQTANIFLLQVPPEQLNMGTPFYGYYYININHEFATCPNTLPPDNAPDCDAAVLSLNYAQLKNRINQNGWETFYDPVAMVPYMVHKNGRDGYMTYDDATSTYLRVWYSDWQRGLGGTFMWSLDADYDGQSQDLMTAMYNASLSTSQSAK